VAVVHNSIWIEEVAVEIVKQIIHALLYVHPWHTLVVHFPIALTSAAFLSILLALWRRSEMFEQFAYYNIVLAALATVVAGLFGLRDHFVRFNGATPYVNFKIFFAVSLLLLTAGIAISRRRNPDLLRNPATRIAYVAAYGGGFLLVSMLGFVGGAIVYGL
jgi:uncharacterized membrane protein